MAQPKAKAPGRHYREGLTLLELMEMFPCDAVAEHWFNEQRWPQGPYCHYCGSMRVSSVKHPTMPYRCKDCRKHFSVRTGTVMQNTKIGYRKWAIAIYLFTTGIKGVSTMKLHRDLGVTQKTAWFMAHRLRHAWSEKTGEFSGPVEVDETYIGERERNKHANKKIRAGRGTVGKTAVIGARDRPTNQIDAHILIGTDMETLQGAVLRKREETLVSGKLGRKT